jgi:hypothetical protein
MPEQWVLNASLRLRFYWRALAAGILEAVNGGVRIIRSLAHAIALLDPPALKTETGQRLGLGDFKLHTMSTRSYYFPINHVA